MLRELRIKNYAIIDEVSFKLSEGFNVITGETGAGKSILVGALSLILGERSSLEGIRQGSDEAILEAAFDPPSVPLNLDEAVEETEILILKRVLSKSGKNRAYLNGAMTTLSTLKMVGEKLVEVHGQQGQHDLGDLDWQRTLLDSFGKLSDLRGEYEKSYQQWNRLRSEQTLLEQQKAESDREASLVEFQLSEIRDAKPDADEEIALEREERTLKQWENLRSTAGRIYAQLSDEGGFLSQLNEAGHALQTLNTITEDAELEIALWEQSQIHLKELSSLLRARLQDDLYSPERLQIVESRLFFIHQLKRKYQRSIPALLAYQHQLEKTLTDQSAHQIRLEEVKTELEVLSKELHVRAETLSDQRAAAALTLETRVKGELERLGMEKTLFQVMLHHTPLSPSGMNRVEFFISLPGEAPSGLAKIASGGELSRIMLALKVVLAEVDPVPTFLFDEVDAGVGGGIAERVGRRLFALSTQHQVLCITHLPQIASLADHHYFVEKKVVEGRTVTSIRALSHAERIEELARMLGGVHITDLSRRHAEEMMSTQSFRPS